MKKLLIIAHQYHAPEMGALRIRRLAHHLTRFGYEPTIIAFNSTKKIKIQDNIRIVDVPAIDLSTAYNHLRNFRLKLKSKNKSAAKENNNKSIPSSLNTVFSTWINRWLMIPDKQFTWIRPAFNTALRLHNSQIFDLVFASIAPKTNGVVAEQFSSHTGCPLFVEFRDLWTGNMYKHLACPSLLHQKIHRHMESKILNKAVKINCLSSGISSYLKETYPCATTDKITHHYNMFDQKEFPDTKKHRKNHNQFIISYIGSIYMSRRPDVFFAGLRKFIDAHELLPSSIQFRWMGRISGVPDIQRMLNRYDIDEYVAFLGHLPHEQALHELYNSDLSLIIQAPEDSIHLPGKMFEALGAHTPILALADVPEMSSIIKHCRAGIAVPHNIDLTVKALEHFWKIKQSKQRWVFNEKEIYHYSCETITQKLAHDFDVVAQ